MGSIRTSLDPTRVVLRGFSMGGAGTWHIGLHYPSMFAAIGPGAGFTTTRDYIGKAKFGPQPDYIEKCLHIYDAVDYAENVFNVPVVAYSGEKDKQKLAADLIEAKLKEFKEPHSFTHLVAPGLEHKQPPEWMAKLETEYRKCATEPRKMPTRNRFVTYTGKYGWCGLVMICPEKHYEKAVVDVLWEEAQIKISTTGVRIVVVKDIVNKTVNLKIDGQPIVFKEDQSRIFPVFEKVNGTWILRPHPVDEEATRVEKAPGVQGPIDDAFMGSFKVALPTGDPWYAQSGEFTTSRRSEFEQNWDKHFRGTLPITREFKEGDGHLVLFGDPASNPMIAKVLPKLPIKWTKDELVMNGKKYDSKTHVPVLIYPNPLDPKHYVVINSGHTFREAELKGTNALLYPRLGDWAVLKPKPTKDDPAGFEVVAAGLFDENWQFEKKK